jgi:putative membrane-bound dehydrogenase-like protein
VLELLALLAVQADEELRSKPTPAAEAHRAFRILPGYRIELAAAEPDVVDPVDLAFDEDGRLFVAEMIDYPYGDAEGNPPQGRIRMLEDRDGDGRYERSTVVAERLRWPTSVACWDGGVLVATVPDVLYLKDTDGDGRADRREVWLTGFGATNVQGLVNNLRWGLDHAFTGATSSSPSRVHSPKWPSARAEDLRGRDFKLHPTGDFVPLSGGGLFGNAFDDFGRRFVCRNWYPAYHVVLDDAALARNPHVSTPAAIHYLAPNPDPVFRASRPEAFRELITRKFLAGELGAALSVPTGRSTAYFTSATGTIVFRGTGLAPSDYGLLFVAEPATNLLHRKRLVPDGVTFKAERIDKASEFLVSTDNWFRPVNLAVGPDGALYVCDMYREFIEHPAAIPDVVKSRLDLTSGKDRGRIWRITREDAPRAAPPRLGKATASELVEAVSRPDAWWRETAHRLLFARQDLKAVPALERLAAESPSPAVRTTALWALEGFAALRPALAARALRDPAPEVREQGVALSKDLEALLPLADDPSPRVRFLLAAALGEFADPRATAALARLAARDGADPWVRAYVLSSASGRAVELLRATNGEIARALASMIGARAEPAELAAALELAKTRPEALAGLAEGLRRANRRLSELPGGADLVAAAARTARDERAPLPERGDAVRLLSSAPFADADAAIAPLLAPGQPEALRATVVRTLVGFRDPGVGARLLDAWRLVPADARAEALGWFRAPERQSLLLDAVEQSRVAPGELSLDLRRALLANAASADRAKRLVGEGPSADRRKVIAAYLPVLGRRGDAARGREIYRKNCVSCHRSEGEGREIGPDLASVKMRSPEELLVAILDPNREINPQFLVMKIRTTSGDVLDGVIAAESAASLTLKRAEGEPVTLPRSSIDRLAPTTLSLMPEGLEKAVDVAQMADLVEYIRRAGE